MKKKGDILYVSHDNQRNFVTIQDAIDNAKINQKIVVCYGIYNEKLTIKKSINLVGENKKNTVINGATLDENIVLIDINAEKIMLSNFTIQNAKGIKGKGIRINNGNLYSRNNIISNNIIKNCSYGVLINNPVENKIVDNKLYGCCANLYFTKKINNENIIQNNMVNDKPSFYFVNKKDMCIDGENTDFISLYNCNNMSISNLNMSHVTVGIDLSFSKNIRIVDNKISDTNRGGIYVHHSHLCEFRKNNLINDNWGIFLRHSHLNKINKNNFINIKMPDWFDKAYLNNWNGNYWGKSISKPYFILGKNNVKRNYLWYNIDWFPLNKPFNGNCVV